MYDLKNWNLRGFAIGASYVYAWDAKPATGRAIRMRTTTKTGLLKSLPTARMRSTPFRAGRAKGTMFKLHFTEYDNHSDIPSWGGGYGNIFGMSVT